VNSVFSKIVFLVSFSAVALAQAPSAPTNVHIVTTGSGPSNVLGLANVQWLGMIKVPCAGYTCDNSVGGRMGMYYAKGERHLVINDDGQYHTNAGRFGPVDFIDAAVYNADGTCVSGCPSTDIAAAPSLTFVGDWSQNADTTVYDWRHGVMKCFGSNAGFSAGIFCDSAGPTPAQICPDDPQRSGCYMLMHYYIVPGSNPPRLYFSWAGDYSGYYDFNFAFCDLVTPPAWKVSSPVTQCYGPFNSESAMPKWPTGDTKRLTGASAGQYFVNLPGGATGWGAYGGGGGFGASKGPGGPTLFKIDALPTTSTSSGYGSARITANTKYLAYYNMVGFQNYDGSVARTQPIWAFRTYNYPYLWAGIPCAINAGSPLGMPMGCGGSTNYQYTLTGAQGAPLAIDPIKNGGVGTMGESDGIAGMVWYQGATKSGVLAFMGQATNHLKGDVRDCTHVVQFYCGGQWKGNSGQTCSGSNDGSWGHPGDGKDPVYQCSNIVNIATGPSNSGLEPLIAIYNPADLLAVAAGTKTDYTVDPVTRIYPLTDISPNMLLAPNGTTGVARAWGEVVQDPNNPHIIYVTAPQALAPAGNGCPRANCFSQQVIVHVFRVTES
jgi:hypothetical protein